MYVCMYVCILQLFWMIPWFPAFPDGAAMVGWGRTARSQRDFRSTDAQATGYRRPKIRRGQLDDLNMTEHQPR